MVSLAGVVVVGVAGCSSPAGEGGPGTGSGGASAGSGGAMASGGATGSGGRSGSGGAATGGTSSGGSGTGGRSGSGGAATGGTSSGGSGIGGRSGSGGTSATGGAPGSGGTTGGSSSGGATASGGRAGGAGTGGSTGTGGRGGGPAGQGGAAAGGQGGRAVKLPPGNAPFDYQLGGSYTPPTGVTILGRDRGAAPVRGLYNLCYVNGFQIQPEEAASWMTNHPDLILKNAQGQPVIDADWNEMLVDTSTAAKRDALLKVVGPWIDGCAASGFDAVDIDNLDSFGRSQGLLTEDDNVAFMGALSARAHAVGLAAGQKNAVELVARAAALGTDFAVAEECNRYGECDQYRQAYGARVFIIEYRRQDYDKGCTSEPDLSIVLRDVNLTTPGSSAYVFDGC